MEEEVQILKTANTAVEISTSVSCFKNTLYGVPAIDGFSVPLASPLFVTPSGSE